MWKRRKNGEHEKRKNEKGMKERGKGQKGNERKTTSFPNLLTEGFKRPWEISQTKMFNLNL